MSYERAYDNKTIRIYLKDHEELQLLKVQIAAEEGRFVTLAEVVGEAVKALKRRRREQAERNVAL